MEASISTHDVYVPRLRPARFAVAAIFVANALLFAQWIARIPDVKQGLALTNATLGLALLCAAGGALIAQLATGWLIGRIGSRRTTVLLAMVFCAAALLPGAAPNLPLLMLALALFGAGNGGLDVAMNAQAALVERAYGRPIMNSFHGLWSLGGLIGATLGGLVAARAVPVGLHLSSVAVVAAIVILLAARSLVVDGATQTSAAPALALPSRALLPLGMIAFGVLLCEGAVGDWSAVYLRDGLSSAPGLAAAGYATFALVMTVGRLAGDWLTLRLGPARIVQGSGVLIIAGIACILLSAVPLGAIVGFGLIGGGAACIFPLVLSAASRTPGVASGTAIAAMATAGYTGFLVGPPLLGSVASVLTLRGALGLLGLVGVLILIVGRGLKDSQHP